MSKNIIISEKELDKTINKVINEQGNFFGRNFAGQGTRAYNQMNDAKGRIQQALQYFNSNDQNSLERGFNCLGDIANYLVRAKGNNADATMMQPIVQSYIQAIQTAAQKMQQYLGGQQQPQQQQPQQQQQYAQDWKTAEKEINQVVKGNFNNWPQQVKNAGWPDDKIAAYRKLANSQQRGGNPQPVMNNPYDMQGAQNAQTSQTSQVPSQNAQNPQAGNQEQKISEAIHTVLEKYLK